MENYTVKIADKTLTINVEDYIKPEKSVPVIFILNVLDEMDLEVGHEEHKYGDISPKLFVSDIACFFRSGNSRVIKEVISNGTFKETLEKQDPEFVADLVIYFQWAGSIFAPVTDAFYSIHNAIKDFVSDNWDKSKASLFYKLID